MRESFRIAACPLIQVTGPDPRLIKAKASPFYEASDGSTTLSSTGVVWPGACTLEGKDHSAVLAPASVIWPFLKQESKGKFWCVDGGDLLPGSKISVICNRGGFTTNSEDAIIELPGRFMGFFGLARFGQLLRGVIDRGRGEWMLGWKLGSPRPQQLWRAHQADIVSCVGVVLVEHHRNCGLGWAVPEVSHACGRVEKHRVHAIGSPFGCVSPHHFLNCIVNGVVVRFADRVADSGEGLGELLVFDGHVLPGMEGALVLDEESLCVVGVLALPLGGSTKEYPLVICFQQIMEGFRKWSSGKVQLGPDSMIVTKPARRSVIRRKGLRGDCMSGIPHLLCAGSVVKVCVTGGGWGSGVVASTTGFIVTCSHVVGNPQNGGDDDVQVQVQCPQSPGWFAAKLIYCFEGYLDLAILKLRRLPSVPLTPAVLTECGSGELFGKSCFAVGFSQESSFTVPKGHGGATIGEGNIAKAVYHSHKHTPILLINVVPVHPGSSGGALFLNNGTLAGLITGNTKHSTGEPLAHLSFGIPIESLRPVFQWANSCSVGNRAELQRLDTVDDQAAWIWRLSKAPEVGADMEPGGPAFKAYLADLEKSLNKPAPKSRL